MSMRRTVAVGALLFLATTSLPAQRVTEKHEFRPGTWIHLGMNVGDVRVEDVKFHKPAKMKGLLTRHDKPNRATVVVRNSGNRPLDLGVAIAVFGEDGTMIAAGNSGATIGILQPGERHEFAIAFHSVFRDIDKATHFLIAAEY